MCLATTGEAQKSPPIHPFQTDQCTFFIEGNWSECCIQHDREYWKGGSLKLRDQSDKKLKDCFDKKGHRILSSLVYWAVHLGHYSPIKSKFKWGWGLDSSLQFEPQK